MKTKLIRLFAVAAVALFVYSYNPVISYEEGKEKLAYPHSKFITVNGLKTHYSDVGTGEVLVLLHGNGGNIHHYDLVRDQLAKKYRIITLDHIGSGLTDVPKEKDYSNENYMAFFEAFFKQLGLTEFYLGGNSMGGYMSSLYAMKHPNQVKKLILIDAYGGVCENIDYTHKNTTELSFKHFKPENLPFFEEFSNYIYPKAIFKSQFQRNIYQPSTDKMIEDTFNSFALKGKRTRRRNFAMLKHDRMLIDGTKLSMPILNINGEKDIIHNTCEAKDLDRRLNNDTLVIIPDAGHLPMYDKPRELENIILSFLAK